MCWRAASGKAGGGNPPEVRSIAVGASGMSIRDEEELDALLDAEEAALWSDVGDDYGGGRGAVFARDGRRTRSNWRSGPGAPRLTRSWPAS